MRPPPKKFIVDIHSTLLPLQEMREIMKKIIVFTAILGGSPFNWSKFPSGLKRWNNIAN